jgi:hypothetical protein
MQKGARTLLDALCESFAKALRSPEGTAEPVALLWTDGDSQWSELIPKLRIALPQLYTLGPYDPATRRGPTIWLRCIVDRSLPSLGPPEGTTPVLYLPGVSRQELRTPADCRRAWQPLIELQYRGRVWHQTNGRDWSVEAFLVSKEGLGLDVAQDSRTREAMLRALPLLAETPIDSLRGRRLEADDFDRLAISDPIRDLLRWMSNPELFQKGLDARRWEAFRSTCRRDFNLDPDEAGPSAAGSALATGGDCWDAIWQRFSEAPRLYPGIPALLREPATGQGKLALDPSRHPSANDEAEEHLRRQLEEAAGLPHRVACERILALEAEHGVRREWVWAQLGESPFATALEPLARLASLAQAFVGGASVEAMAEAYAAAGWQCDWAAIESLASTKRDSESAVIAKVIRALYEPWLDASARLFQDLVAKRGGDLRAVAATLAPEKETCLVFADGLRFDVGALLKEKLESRGLLVRLGHRIAPLPTVTATAKPVVSPAWEAVDGSSPDDDFTPVLGENKQRVSTAVLRQEILRRGVAILEPDEAGRPARSEGGAWVEVGRPDTLDTLGHKLQARLVQQIESQAERIVERVAALLEAGWPKVRIVTDHGWLLLPGGLPKVELPASLVATKWTRCAAVRGDSAPAVPTYLWHWNPFIRIASPPGIACFLAGHEYAHGGVSLQECVVPDIIVERAGGGTTATIAGIQWRGMRCRVSVRTNNPAVRVDLRLNWKQPATSIVAAVKEVGAEGEASLAVSDDTYEGAAAVLVVLDPTGNVLDKRTTSVGEVS